ncbi:MAG: TolC family protein [Wenzhouxiangellaceae bacterium]|nr:TolC family protein [Wenzhouxiangellaceae bacterium]
MRSQLQSVLTLILCGLALAMPVPGSAADAAEKQLSLQQALEIARLENPQIAIGRARKDGAQGARVRSRQGFSPRLTLDAYYLRLDTSLLDNIPVFEPRFPPTFVERNFGPVDGNVVSVELVQPLINIGAWNARRQAGHGVDAAGLQLRRVEDEIEVAVVKACYGARTAERQVGAERKGLATAHRALLQARAVRQWCADPGTCAQAPGAHADQRRAGLDRADPDPDPGHLFSRVRRRVGRRRD